VELGGDLCVLEGAEVDEDVLYVGAIVFCLEEEGCGGELVGGEDGVELVEGGVGGEPAGIDDEGEVGAGVDGGVYVGFSRGGEDVLVVGVGAEEDG